MTETQTDLTGIGDLRGDYQHHPKLITPGDDIALTGSHLKWYDVRRSEAVISDEVGREARDLLRSETEAGRLELAGELGFAVLHLCGDSFFFLIVCTWRNENELWETAYTKDGGPFQRVTQDGHRATFCVWELGAVLHEQQAWTHYLYSARDEPAKRAYLADRFTGTV